MGFWRLSGLSMTFVLRAATYLIKSTKLFFSPSKKASDDVTVVFCADKDSKVILHGVLCTRAYI